jgi:alpha-galactosidase
MVPMSRPIPPTSGGAAAGDSAAAGSAANRLPANHATRGRHERWRNPRQRAIIIAGVAAGCVLLLVAIGGIAWVAFVLPPKTEHVAAAKTATSTPSVVPTATASPSPTPEALRSRDQMALTPPMGWNSWNDVGCTGLTAAVVENAADEIVARGLKSAGYQYVVVDDCWQAGRNAAGELIPDPTRFPDGMKAVADYVHKDGLKFGIYAVPGSQTCGNYFSQYPVHSIGSLGHEKQDAEQFASWGVDYLKYDWCRADINDHLVEQTAFRQMEQDLDATGRNIVFSISEYGVQQPWLWGPGVANLWRTTHDIHPLWSSVMQHIAAQVPITQYAKPGAWNDPDMLEIGDGGLTDTEETSHFAMWCMLAAPLFVGTDISALPIGMVSLLTNPELVGIDQDADGHEAHLVSSSGGIQVWERPLAGGRFAVALFNTTSATQSMSATLAQLGIPAGSYTVRDAIVRVAVSPTSSVVSGSAPSHGIVVYELTPAK